jgi:FkbM family methyltransferase
VTTLSTRTIDAPGGRMILAGLASDDYFRSIGPPDPTNDFMAHVGLELLPGDAIIFDVGASIGYTTALLAMLAPAARIFSFEPSPIAWPHLNQTITLNNLSHRCQAFQLALGAREGLLPFFDNPRSTSVSHLAVNGDTLGADGPHVCVSTVDALVTHLALKRLDLLKIDVEGFELDVLDGAMNSLGRFRPKVFLEFNSFTLIAFRNINPRTALERLLGIFSSVSWLSNGQLIEIKGSEGTLGFLHANLVEHGCVDELLCLP